MYSLFAYAGYIRADIKIFREQEEVLINDVHGPRRTVFTGRVRKQHRNHNDSRPTESFPTVTRSFAGAWDALLAGRLRIARGSGTKVSRCNLL